MKVVILAGGYGSRLSEETTARPKPLVEIGEKPIIWHVMQIYAHHGLTDFIVCAGYKGYMLKEYFSNLMLHNSDITVDLSRNIIEYHNEAAPNWRVTVVDTGLNTMTGGRLKRIRRHLDDGQPFCLTYGDGVGDVNISGEIEFHRDHGLKATMCAVTPPGRFGVIDMNLNEHRITAFNEKPKNDSQRVNGGFFILDPSVVDLIEDDATVWETGPLQALAEQGELAAFIHDGFWQPMDTLRERILLDDMWRTEKAPWKIWA
ncbi:glucose-1-phosphate cytidylyltransferase [Rhizobium sp. BK251]|uniref:glucose-1-phosphate cytidylyltransferase n=1 Tax=Rhizobium sp. BK251 TaxID=2512125 RepID=UPI00104E73DB|nr:glucose-1-phosphate cytidylyltransferase [Rhizobium sp. BK251]TCL75618.1 glucose-1-phosphate cytidylyltransferase [Rhizobium sp. BK251]